jgi:acetyltransferase
MASTSDLDPLFQPRSVAVVGASSRPESVGHAVFKNLLFGSMAGRDRSKGFPGPVYGVNHKGGEILGQKIYENLEAIGDNVDLVMVAIPPRFIPALMSEAGKVGTKVAVVISAGFAEMGEEGRALQEQMADAAKSASVRIVGPNCLGVMRPSEQLNASFAATMPGPGPIGLLSQSGALVTGVVSYSQREDFGLSAAVSLGAKADIEDHEVIEWLAQDEQTKAIALYVEAFPEPDKFFATAAEVTKKTPIVAIKGGATEAGAKAASSHTGSLAGSNAAYRAAFAQSGVLQAERVSDFVGWARALATQPPAAGNRVAIVTNAGGPGVLAADEAVRLGLRLAELSPETMKRLDAVLPSVWSRGNPVDIIGDATPKRYQDALDILGASDEVDGIVTIMTVQAMTNPMETAEAIANAHHNAAWTAPMTCSFIGLQGTDVGKYLDQRGVPEFNVPENAVSAMAALARRGAWLRRDPNPPAKSHDLPPADYDRARAIVEEARKEGQTNLDLGRARQVLEAAGLRYNHSGRAGSEDEAVAMATDMGFPVVIKVISPDVLHKSDVGAVVLDVVDGDGVREACAKIRANVAKHVPGARIQGFVVAEQVGGTEIIVGVSRDPQFGPLLMVGMGGIFVEVYKDVAFRPIPLSRADALDQIGEIQAQPLLDGARGRPVLDRHELAEVMLRISGLVEAVDAIEELDVNPLVITPRGLVSIDARVIAKS